MKNYYKKWYIKGVKALVLDVLALALKEGSIDREVFCKAVIFWQLVDE